MRIFYRFKRLIRSDLHGVLEGMEKPQQVLAQALRDMEDELEKLKQTLEAHQGRADAAAVKAKQGEELLQALEKDIDFAISEKKEDIAKSLIKKRLLTQQHQELLKREEEQNRQAALKLEAEYGRKKDCYAEICARAESSPLTTEASERDEIFVQASHLLPQDPLLQHQVELEFLRRLQQHKTQEKNHAH